MKVTTLVQLVGTFCQLPVICCQIEKSCSRFQDSYVQLRSKSVVKNARRLGREITLVVFLLGLFYFCNFTTI